MQNLYAKIESLDLKIRLLIEKTNSLRRENKQLIEENTKIKKEKSQYIDSIDKLKSEINALMQNNNRDTQLEDFKVKEVKEELALYIEEIDTCIKMLKH